MVLPYYQIQELIGKIVCITEGITKYLARITTLSNEKVPNNDDDFFIHLEVLLHLEGTTYKKSGKYPLMPYMMEEYKIEILEPTEFPKNIVKLQEYISAFTQQTIILHSQKCTVIAELGDAKMRTFVLNRALYYLENGDITYRPTAEHVYRDMIGTTLIIPQQPLEYAQYLAKIS